MQIWILTHEINEYNQDGEYFDRAFAQKPTIDQIKEACRYNEMGAKHVLNGGGRKNNEYMWFNLKVMEVRND